MSRNVRGIKTTSQSGFLQNKETARTCLDKNTMYFRACFIIYLCSFLFKLYYLYGYVFIFFTLSILQINGSSEAH